MLKVNLFFDESGKNDDAVKTMGSLMIPEKVYNCKEIVALNERLRKENLYLKAELEYSKKLRAVVQARKNQQQKKK